MSVLGIAEDKRKEYAAALRNFADQIETMDGQPAGIRTFVFSSDGSVYSCHKSEYGGNAFHIAGSLQMEANDVLARYKSYIDKKFADQNEVENGKPR